MKPFQKISEVAKLLGVPASRIRYYDKYAKPMRRGGLRRYYRPEDVEILRVKLRENTK